MSKGYKSRIHDEIVSDIGTLYTDHYSILKELVQNADDAGASELSVAFLHPSKQYSHPLLAGPLLLFVNDAKFTLENAQAIHQRRNSDKTADGSKIGMFGLGLKSLFHLCQAFFYVSSPDLMAAAEVEEGRKFRRSDILNPWGDERFREWDNVLNSDLTLLQDLSSSFLLGQSTDWFALIVPLRLRGHCIERATQNPKRFAFSNAEDSFFDESGSSAPPMLFSDDVLSDLPRLMPLLSTLDRISFWISRDSETRTPFGSVERTPQNHTNWRTMDLGCVPLSGRVDVHSATSGRTATYYYGGIQQRMLSSDLEQVRSRTSWPEIWPDDESADAPVKVEIKQHSAVVFLDGNGPEPLRGFLDTVFLPLTRGKPQEIAVNAGKCSDVLLHAARFPDSARKKIDRLEAGRSQGEETVRQAWNRVIEQQGIYPLVIPALKVYADTRSSSPNSGSELKELTKELSEGSFSPHQKSIICEQVRWCFCLHNETFEWRACGKHKPLIELPPIDNLQGDQAVEILTIFPAIRKCFHRYTITVSGYPRLSMEKAETTVEFVADLLRSITLNNVARNAPRWEYLRRCIKAWKAVLNQDARKQLVALAKSYFRTLELNDESTVHGIKALLATLPAEMSLPVSTELPLSEADKRLLESLWAADEELIVAPKELLPETQRKKISLEKVETLIKHLMDCSAQLKGESRVCDQQQQWNLLKLGQATESLVLDILAIGEIDIEQRERFERLRVWHLYSGTLFKCVCLNELETLVSEHMLFKLGHEVEATKYITCISELEQSPKFLNEATATALNELGWLSPLKCFGAAGFLTLLQRRPSLHDDVVLRRECASRLAQISLKPARTLADDHRMAIRYLLHGSKDDTDMTRPLFLARDDGWSALALAILEMKNEAWRLIDTELADFGPLVLRELIMVDCKAETVTGLLVDNADFSKIDCRPITDSVAKLRQLLQDWPLNDFGLLRKLRVFQRSSDQKLISATGPCLIQGPLSTQAAEVFKQYSFINDPTGILAFRKIIRPAVPDELLVEALDQSEPHKNWRFVLDSLHGNVING